MSLQLNNEQRKAIESTEGPLVIIAGAGTGKTRVITEKVLYLINEKNISPRNILAVTYSNRASQEMQERINERLKTYYYDMEITTFHSFCNRIMQEYGSHIGIPSNFVLLNDIGIVLFLKKIYDKLNLTYFYSLTSSISFLTGFSKFFSRAKDEMVSPEDFKKYVELQKILFQKNKNDLTQEQKSSFETKLIELNEEALIYQTYQKEMLKAGYLDFNDLIIYSILLFNKRPHILSKYQERFKYILVDEFQDTNIAQIELLRLLASKYRNITVVGDDDQSIYHFRGASYASFIRFNEIFPEANKITLSQNYRSTKNILSLANEIINLNALSRFDADKKLFTQNEQGKKITIVTANDFESEAKYIVEKIKNIYSNLPDSLKSFNHFAVLYRAHTHKDKLLELLNEANIPFQIKKSLDFFSHPKVKDLVALLKVINDPFDNISLFRILSLKSFSWEDKLSLNRLAKEKEISLFHAIDADEKLKNIFSNVKLFIGRMSESALKLSLWEIFALLAKEIKTSDFSDLDLENSNLIEFYSIVTDFIENNTLSQLKNFLEYLDILMLYGDIPSSDNFSDTLDAVQLMTIHGSKGLEFPYVFIIGLVSRRFPGNERYDLIQIPDELMKEPLPKGDYHLQEERRLFYVGLTRASSEIYLTCIDKKGTSPSIFIKEIRKLNITSIIEETSYNNKDNEINILLPMYDLKDNQIVENYSPKEFSYTQIETYNACPLKYKYRYILHIPVLPNPIFSFGNIMHATLEEYYLRIKDGNNPDWQELNDIFNEKWNPRGFNSQQEIEKNKNIALEQLKCFYDKNSILSQCPVALEQKFEIKIPFIQKDILNKDEYFKIIGRIDRIDALDKEKNVEIIDYKTGKPKDQKNVDKDIQLSIYAIACREKFNLNPVKLSFYYLKNNQKISTERNDKELNNTKNIIFDIINKIREKNFAPSPSDFNCQRCEYKNFCAYY
ncbi:MAG: UvrD-helicase domain-containing protein [Candidatus Firestonebacteria bacterium]|nr:UvrD-helicase domain-containing protein [Candidatus Firestonebacteria bacterium]